MRFAIAALLIVFALSQTYDYENNGDDWSGTCFDGEFQSPVDITTAGVDKPEYNELIWSDLGDLSSKRINNDNERVYIDQPSSGSELNYVDTSGDETTFSFDYMQIRTPSEHVIDGVRFGMEIQFYFVKSDTEKAAIAIFLDDDADSDDAENDSDFIDQLNLDNLNGGTASTLDFEDFIDSMPDVQFFTYEGS